MCLIIDADRGKSFGTQLSPYARLIVEWVGRRGKVVVGGELLVELNKTGIRKYLSIWRGAGQLVTVNDGAVRAEQAQVVALGCELNDTHVVALARLSGVRLVFTGDEALMKDLRNRKLLQPRGKVLNEEIPGGKGVRTPSTYHRSLLYQAC